MRHAPGVRPQLVPELGQWHGLGRQGQNVCRRPCLLCLANADLRGPHSAAMLGADAAQAEQVMTDQPENLVLVQLRGMRREMAAILENQRRDRELITRLALRVDQGFARVDEALVDLRRDIGEIRSDMVQLENGLLNRHTEILDVMRRLDQAGQEPVE